MCWTCYVLRAAQESPSAWKDGRGDANLDEIHGDERIKTPGECDGRPDGNWMREPGEPCHAPGENYRQPCHHGEERGEIAPIESTRGEPSRKPRSERVAHEITAGRTEQSKRPLWQRG